jgi:hypothetical protein
MGKDASIRRKWVEENVDFTPDVMKVKRS